MRAYLLFLILLPSVLLAQSVSYQDSLQSVIQNSADGVKKANTYQLLISELQEQNPQVTRKLIAELYDLSNKIHYPLGIANAYFQQGIYYNLEGKFDSLRYYAEKCLETSRQYQMVSAQAQGNQLLGVYYWQTGKYPESTNYHLKALKIREGLKDEAGIGSSLSSLGAVSFSNNQPELAKQYAQKALLTGRKIKDEKLVLKTLHLLANISGSAGDYQQALKYDTEALEICAKTNNRRGFSEVYSNMATCYFFMGQYDASLHYHSKVLEIDRFFKDDKQIGDTYFNMAGVYHQKKDYQKAILLLNEAIKLFESSSYPYGLRQAYQLLSQIYQDTHDYKRALLAHQQYVRVANQISNEKNEKHIAELNIQYETEKKEQQLQALNQQVTIQKLELVQRNTFLAIIIGLFFISIMLGYLIYNRRKIKARAQLQEAIHHQQNLAALGILGAEERERRRIASELHDGVGQTLSCALMNFNSLFSHVSLNQEHAGQAQKALALLSESYDEMRSISHQMIPHVLMKDGLSSAIRELVQRIDLQTIRIQLEISGLDRRLDQQVETGLYRVTQEAVNNVMKHARASHLTIQLLKDVEGISLSIEDNGCGFDPAHIAQKEGIGLKNIYSRIAFLKGTVDLQSAPGKGTLLMIHLPA